jgi:O-antigen ligase
MMRIRNTQSALNLLAMVKFGLYLLLFSPLVFSEKLIFFYLSTKDAYIIAIALVGLLAFVWLLYMEPAWRKRLSLIDKLVFLYIAIILFASLIGVDPVHSFFSDVDRNTGGVMMVHIGLIYLLARSVFKTKKDWEKAFIISISVAVVVALFHLLSLSGVELAPHMNGGSTLGNSSFFGTYLLFQIFFSLILACTTASDKVKNFGRVVFLLLTITLFTTTANTAIIALMGAAVFLFGLRLMIHGHLRMGKGVIGALAIGFVLTIALLTQSGSFVHDKFVETASESRFLIWDMAVAGIKERPLFGWGPENFEVLSLEHYNSCFGSIRCGQGLWFDRAHNKILDVLVDTGIVGLLAYAAILLVATNALWREHVNRSNHSWAPALVLSLLAAYVVQNLTTFDISVTLMFWVLTLAYIGTLTDGETSGASIKSIPVSVPVAVTLLVPLMFFIFVIQPIRGNAAVIQASDALTITDRLDAIERGMTVSPVGIDYRREYLALESAVLIWKNDRETLQQFQATAMKEIDLAKKYLSLTIDRSPNRLQAMINLGLMYQTEARYFDAEKFQDAEKILQRAIDQNQDNALPSLALASVYLDQGAYEEALTITEEVLAKDRAVDQSHIYRLIVLRFIGDKERLAAAVQDSIAAFPNLPTFNERLQVYLDADIETTRDALIFQFYILL